MDCSIIGVSMRLPEGLNSEEYWKALLNETSFLKGMSPTRQQLHKNEQSRPWGDVSEVKGMYLDDIDCFDRQLFSMSKPALMFTDPRQRLLLESCWSAIEDSGLRVSALKGKKVGVFIAQDSFEMSSYFRNIPTSELSAQEFVIPGNVTSFLANRISNVFDFKGPSMVVDTTCSSAYVAIHYARLALERGECDYAIVGGVTLFLEPWRTGESKPTSFESNVSDIHSFGEDAEGYCSSEGCGAILLQRSHPEDDKKQSSYGVIIGSGNNAGGKTNSFAQPNQEQQEVLLKTILKEAGKHPKDIEYVESHGIGSEVGDAIEANSLINVFKRNDGRPCYISTIKPNIGHTHAASGLYSLFKALLAMKYGRIPGIKGLDTTKLNKKILEDRNGVEFVTKSIDWNKNKSSEKRLVFLTSYGFSNVNAGILIQEAEQYSKDNSGDNSEGVLICLSTETKNQLEEQKKRLLKFISSESNKGTDLISLAYTLQSGREQLRYRFAIRVNSLAQLEEELSSETGELSKVVDSRFPIESVKELLKDKQALDKELVKSLEEGNLENLAKLWVNGVNIEWEFCYKDKAVKRLHIPTYPFAKEQFWIPKTRKATKKTSGEKLHPLLHSNISDLVEHKYQSTFSGEETFLSDHKVRGEKVFPGVALIEMARAAGERSIHKRISKVKDIRWLRPIQIDGVSNTIEISLFEKNDSIAYEIYSGSGELEIVYSQGILSTDEQTPPPSYNIDLLKERLVSEKTSDECYAFFKEKNLALGSSYQGIKNFFYSENEALSSISLPKELDVILPTGLLDSALQTSAILNLLLTESLALPYSIKEVTIYGDLNSATWCYARKSTKNKGSKVDSFDIDILSDSGHVLLSFIDFVTLPLDGFSQEHYQKKSEDQSKWLTDTVLDENINQNVVVPISKDQKKLKTVATIYFKEILSGILQLSVDNIDTTDSFEKYGIDSIMISKLTNRLSEVFENLSSTLFFEYQNLEGLIDYFVEEHSKRLEEITNVSGNTEGPRENNRSDSKFENTRSHRPRFSAPIKKEPSSQNSHIKEDIAIVGISGRFPGAENVNQFWHNLKNGVDSVVEIPKERWNLDDQFDPEKGKKGKSYSKWGGFIDDVDKFDPLFFNISPKEAEIMDPQERIFLQTVWGTIQDAGYTRDELRKKTDGSIGVYVGVMYSEYQLFAAEQTLLGNPIALSISPSSIANRVSYFCNFSGPSMALDTMCSSSLTAIHLACEAIHTGDCRYAIAGGVNVSIHSNKYLMLSQGTYVSSKGRCESFGEGGDGYVPAEGVGAVLLKPLSEAIKDNDQIYGVVKGSSINHGGKTNGYTVPNPIEQSKVIKKALDRANVAPESISYLEAHGTGTSLGDPIEIAGLSRAFQTDRKQFCKIGSVKSNIGHAESAAGISGFIKILLQLKFKQLVPSIHSTKLNPNIDFDLTPFVVQQKLESWKKPIVNGIPQPRIAGISSFGAGGANAHIVIEEFEQSYAPIASDFTEFVIPVSAKNKRRLKASAQELLTFLNENKNPNTIRTAEVIQVDLQERISRLVNIDIEDLNSDVDFEEFGIDKLILTKLAEEIEIEFNLNYFTEEILKCRTINECVSLIERQIESIIDEKKQNTQSVDQLNEIAWMLQVGREHMDERVVFVVKTIKELILQLEQFVDGNQKEFIAGNIKATKDYFQTISNDEDFQYVVDKWIEKGLLEKIGRIWTQGVNIQWHKFYKAIPNKISLPTYPFAKDRYWVPENENGEVSLIQKAQPSVSEKNRSSDILKKNLVRYEHQNECFRDGKVIILAEKEGLGLIEDLKNSFKEVMIIQDCSQALLSMSDNDFKDVSGVIDLCPMSNCNNELNWFELLQKVVTSSDCDQLKLMVISQGKTIFTDFSSDNLYGAVRFGLYRMLQAEYGKIDSVHIDIADGQIGIAELISSEFYQNSKETELIYKDNQLFCSKMERIERFVPIDGADKVKIDGAVFITGGTRGLGMSCAKHLVKNCNVKKLVLTGQQVIPERDQWENLKEENSKIKDLLWLISQGVELSVLSVSLTDEGNLEQEIEKVRNQMGKISGVLHCAGTIDSHTPAFISKETNSVASLLAPKITGLENLHAAFEADRLDFFILFSSVSSIIPQLGSGNCDYTMGNSFMDSFANFHKGKGFPYLSVNWPSWKETGMGEVKGGKYESLGFLSITDKEGMDFLDRMLIEKKEGQLTPMISDEAKFNLEEILEIESKKRVKLKLNREHEVGALKVQGVTKWLLGLFSAELKIKEIDLDIDTSFQEYGVDSIILVQLVKRIEKELEGTFLDPSIFLENSTITLLGEFLEAEYTKELLQVLNAPLEPTKLVPIEADIKEELQEVKFQNNKVVPEVMPVQELDEKKPASMKEQEKVAVVGMACHFPDAPNIQAFWENLKNGKDSIVEVPKTRWNTDELYEESGFSKGKSLSKWGAFLPEIEHFDPGYFGVSEALGAQIDPLERQWLEVSTEALMCAGYDKKTLWAKKVGVFAGSRTSTFADKVIDREKDYLVGVGQNFITAHLAHIYNFKGPNMVVDTACSSSLTAIHLAVNSLLAGETEVSLAGGVDILLDEMPYLALSAAGVLSTDGRSKTFDENADGTGVGEGCGVLVLKRLSDAIQAGDKVYGVIDGTAVNNDGNTMGITTPNPKSQQELIEDAIIRGNVPPESITYMETHGTGTAIGDPIELRGITKALGIAKNGHCGVGSVKTNVGHLLSAAGIAGVIKVLLSINAKQLPPTLNCDKPNPRFDFEKSPVFPVLKLQDWSGHNGVLRGGVSAFGLGGSNAHVILSDANIPPENKPSFPFKVAAPPFNNKWCWPSLPPLKMEVKQNQIELVEEEEFDSFFEFDEVN